MLRLRIVSDHRASLGKHAEMTLHAGDLTVGRGPENGWVLPDPDLLLSRQHCVFEKAGDRYRVIDTSTNGVFLNGSERALGRNAPATLTGGDCIRIGRFIIEAVIETLDAPSFTEIAGAFRTPGADGPVRDGFRDADPFADIVRPPPLSPSLPVSPPPFAFDGAFDGGPIHPFDSPQASEDWRFGTVDDHASAVHQAVRVTPSEAVPSATAAPVIPDDWDVSIFSAVDQPAAALDGPALSPAPVQPLPDDWDVDAPLDSEPPPFVPPPDIPPPAPPSGNGADAALAAFFAGFGAPLPPGGMADAEALLRGMGEALRVSLGALHGSLNARSHFKDEFHLEQTSFRPAGENPLKRCADLDEAVAVLADPDRRGFLPMAAAVREAADDVQVHHLAYAAALQTTLKRVVAKFDPQALSQRLETRLLDSLVPGARKARYWDQYEALYKDLVVELEEDFDRAVGDAIAAEYERRTRTS